MLTNIIAVITADRRVRKATVALAAGSLGALAVAMADGGLTGPELVIAAGAGLGAAAAVFQVRNG